MHWARNAKSASVCAGKSVLARLRLPRIAELCNRHAAAPECGDSLLTARIIPPSRYHRPRWTTRLHRDVLKCSAVTPGDRTIITVIANKGALTVTYFITVKLWWKRSRCYIGYNGSTHCNDTFVLFFNIWFYVCTIYCLYSTGSFFYAALPLWFISFTY